MQNTKLCLVSALGGALVALVATQLASLPALYAQPAPRAPRTERVAGPVRPDQAVRTDQVPFARNPAPPTDDLSEFTPEERTNITVYERVNRSVVNISTKGVDSQNFLLWEVPSEGAGSGTIVDSAGHILTNFHVVEGARKIDVTLFNAETLPARIVGGDAGTDVAIIKIDAPPELLSPVAFGDSTRLRVGQRAFAIGNPFGLERTLTTGVISSLNRELPGRNHRKLRSIIQIDAAINPGNSGGPLLDSHGRLIGMNTAIASRTGQSSGVGFAIPISTIARIVPQLIGTGHVTRPEVGIVRVYQTDKGLLINLLSPGGPAERAGLQGPKVTRKRRGPLTYETVDLKAADLIVAVDGTETLTADDFLSQIESKRPGDTVVIRVIRDGSPKEFPVQLEQSEG
jgi:S1-C subfamily serine protease